MARGVTLADSSLSLDDIGWDTIWMHVVDRILSERIKAFLKSIERSVRGGLD